MKKVKCLIRAKCFVNEAGNVQNPVSTSSESDWRQRGEVFFKLDVDPEDIFHADTIFYATIDELLSDLSDYSIRYIYEGHDLIFGEIQELKGYKETFDRLLEESY